MSLRELPPDQVIIGTRWRRLRYVPLVILLTAAIVASGVGVAVSRAPAAVPTPTASADSSRLPEQCHPATATPATSPWTGAAQASSEQIWADHAADLSTAYVLGQDSWVFWGDIQANNFSQAVGRRALTPEELGAWHDYFATLDSQLSEAGIQLYIVITPAKWAVYRDELPQWSQPLVGPGPLDQLMAVGSDLPLVDIREPLIEASATVQTYSRVNSHWSDYGAYVGWNAIANCITANEPALALSPLPVIGVTVTDKYNEFANYGLASPEPDYTIPVFGQPLMPVTLGAAGEAPTVVDGTSRTDLTQLPATTTTSGAQSSQSLLLVRDSFGTSLSIYAQQAFASTLQVRHNIDAGPGTQPDILTLAKTYLPKVVILQIAQRHLNWPPPA